MTRAALLHGVDMAFARAGERGHARAPSVALETRPEFRVLLATDPATARDDAERAIAQFARVGPVRVDVVHVVNPGGLTREIWQRVHDTLAGPRRDSATL